MTTSLPTAFNVTTPNPTVQPFYEEPPFIVGMAILAILILFICLATLLCCIKPRGNKTSLEKSQLSQTPPLNQLSPGHASKSSPKRAPVTGSWSPNDNTLTVSFPLPDPPWQNYPVPYSPCLQKGEIPDFEEPEIPYLGPEVSEVN